MAVILGQYKVNKELDTLDKAIALDAKMDKLLNLIEMAKPLENLAEDIYDTYWHLKRNDSEFAEKLWHLLCKKDIGQIDINSYFSWGIWFGGYVHLSKHGLCIKHRTLNDIFQNKYGLSEEEIYRGKVSLTDYIEDFSLTEKLLDIFIEELESFIKYFPLYAKRFFESVSQYKIVE